MQPCSATWLCMELTSGHQDLLLKGLTNNLKNFDMLEYISYIVKIMILTLVERSRSPCGPSFNPLSSFNNLINSQTKLFSINQLYASTSMQPWYLAGEASKHDTVKP